MEGNTVRRKIEARRNGSILLQLLINIGHPYPPSLGDGMNKQHGNSGERDFSASFLPIRSELLDIIPWF